MVYWGTCLARSVVWPRLPVQSFRGWAKNPIMDGTVSNLATTGFNDRALSLRVEQGYWMFCNDTDYPGECLTYGPGEYPTLLPEFNHRISSARRISHRYPYNQNPTWSSGDLPSHRGPTARQ
jgi:Beta/Gamma crystallin